jgi:hypothetical protein
VNGHNRKKKKTRRKRIKTNPSTANNNKVKIPCSPAANK